MEYARNEPGVSVYRLMAQIASIPPWTCIPLIYRNQEDTPHAIVFVATARYQGSSRKSQWRRKRKQQEWACRVIPGRKKHERPADGK